MQDGASRALYVHIEGGRPAVYHCRFYEAVLHIMLPNPPRAQVEGDIWKFKRDIETSWGEWFTFEARNEYGAITYPKTLCTTDYFTDPDIIEQIQRYYEEDKYLAKVEEVIVEPEDDAPCQYFNLQGLPINNPRQGEIVIRKRGSKTDKIVY